MTINHNSLDVEGMAARDQKNRTFDVQLDVAHQDLETRVKKSFDFAKSAGFELDVTFSYFGISQSAT
jgi:hypothetical protein